LNYLKPTQEQQNPSRLELQITRQFHYLYIPCENAFKTAKRWKLRSDFDQRATLGGTQQRNPRRLVVAQTKLIKLRPQFRRGAGDVCTVCVL